MSPNKDAFFSPQKMTGQQKNEITDSAARQIIAAEAQARGKKTEKLKALRLQQAGVVVPEAPVEVKSAKKKKK